VTCWRSASLPTWPLMRTLLPSIFNSPPETCCRSGPSIATTRSRQFGGAITASTSIRSTTRWAPYNSRRRPRTAALVASSGTVPAAITGCAAATGAGAVCARATGMTPVVARSRPSNRARRRNGIERLLACMSGSEEGLVERLAGHAQRQVVALDVADQLVERVVAADLVVDPFGIVDPDDPLGPDLRIECSLHGATVSAVEADQQLRTHLADAIAHQQHQLEVGAAEEAAHQI